MHANTVTGELTTACIDILVPHNFFLNEDHSLAYDMSVSLYYVPFWCLCEY